MNPTRNREARTRFYRKLFAEHLEPRSLLSVMAIKTPELAGSTFPDAPAVASANAVEVAALDPAQESQATSGWIRIGGTEPASLGAIGDLASLFGTPATPEQAQSEAAPSRTGTLDEYNAFALSEPLPVAVSPSDVEVTSSAAEPPNNPEPSVPEPPVTGSTTQDPALLQTGDDQTAPLPPTPTPPNPFRYEELRETFLAQNEAKPSPPPQPADQAQSLRALLLSRASWFANPRVPQRTLPSTSPSTPSSTESNAQKAKTPTVPAKSVAPTPVVTPPSSSNQPAATPSQPTPTALDRNGPRVVSARIQTSAKPKWNLAIQFSEPLIAGTASDPRAYVVEQITPAEWRLLSDPGAIKVNRIYPRTPVPIGSASYDPASRTTTLVPASAIRPNSMLLITNSSQGSHPQDLAGNAIDGNNDGQPDGQIRVLVPAARTSPPRKSYFRPVSRSQV